MSRLRAAVVGAGNMGRHHIRILAGMSDVDLVAIVDPDASRPTAHASAAGVTAYGEVEEIPAIDFGVVASPTPTHVSVASALMRRGASVLVEKPLASTPGEAEELVRVAEETGVVLAVGHIERFNAAIDVLAQLTKNPIMLSFERLSPYTPRIKDSVVFDLMVHDLDLACWIAGGYPTRVQASGHPVFSSELDVAAAVLEYPSGCIATLQASRATQDKVRRISVSERERFIVADSVRQDVSIKREAEVDYAEVQGPIAYRQASVVEIPYLDRSGEPLERELRDFVEAVRGEHAPLVGGAAGLVAVRLAYEVERAAGSQGST